MLINKRILIGCAALLLAADQALAVDIQHWTQPDGARVYFVAAHGNPIVDIRVDFDAGSRRDQPNALGVADMAAGLLDAGAGNLDEEGIRMRIADLAIQLNTFSDMESAGVSLRSLSRAETLQPALQLAAQIISQPRFPQDVIEREKLRSIEGLKQAESDPGFLADRALTALMYPNHPYGYPALETEATVAAIKRDAVLRFWQQHYQPRYAVVSIVGDLTKEQAMQAAQTLLAGLKNQGDALSVIPPVPAAPAGDKRLTHPATQAHIDLGMPLITRDDPDYYALLVGNYVLGGGGFDSRLMKEVRDKRGLTYGVSSSMEPMQRPGAFQIGLSTRKEQADAALQVVRDTVARYVKEGPSQIELNQAKANIIGGFPLRFDSNSKLLAYLSVIGQYQLPLDFLDRYPQQVQKLTTAQVRDAWQRRIDPSKLSVVVVGGESGK